MNITTKKLSYSATFYVYCDLGKMVGIGTVTKAADSTWEARPFTKPQGEEEVTTHKAKKDAVNAVVRAVRDNDSYIHGHGTRAGQLRDVSMFIK